MSLFGDPKEKLLKRIFEGEEDLLFHNDLNELKAYVESSILSKHASMMSVVEEQVKLGRSVPPKSEWKHQGIYESLEEVFGTTEQFYEAIFDARLAIIFSTMVYTALVALTVPLTIAGWLIELDFVQSEDMALTQWIGAAALALFMPLFAAIPAGIALMIIGAPAVNVTGILLGTRLFGFRKVRLASTWKRMIHSSTVGGSP